MKTEGLILRNWDDLVFEGRNKEYGAYTVRNSYSKHVVIAVILTSIIVALVLAYPKIVELFIEAEEVVKTPSGGTIIVLDPPPPVTKTLPPPKLDVPPPVKTIVKYIPPRVTDREIVEEDMPTIQEIKQNDTGSKVIEGTGVVVFTEPVEKLPVEGTGEEEVFVGVEQMPEFEGGIEAMNKFIGKNMKYPANARRMGVDGTVFVSFVVNKEGKIRDIAIMKGISADCDNEAMRVVSLMPNWKPGKQNGKTVSVKFVLPIKFKLAM